MCAILFRLCFTLDRDIGARMAKSGNLSVLLVTTWAFTVCFAVWMMFGVTGIPIRTQLGLDSTQFGLLTATPVLTGALFRLPLGIWTDRFGGRIIMLLLLVGCAVPLWMSSYATALWQFLLLGWRWAWSAPRFQSGRPMSRVSFRRTGADSRWAFRCRNRRRRPQHVCRAAFLINAYGWQMVPGSMPWRFWSPRSCSGSSPRPILPLARAQCRSMRRKLSVLRDPRVWKYCQYYSIVFGGFTALSVWMPQYFKDEYGFRSPRPRCSRPVSRCPAGISRSRRLALRPLRRP